jgi:hypothetical protein
MAVLTSKKRDVARDPLKGEERFENEKLYRKGVSVEKCALSFTRSFSTAYAVEKT